MAYIFGTKHDIKNQASALTTTRGILHCLETTWTIGPKTAWNRHFYLPSENFAFFFIAGLHTCTSYHRTQPNFCHTV